MSESAKKASPTPLPWSLEVEEYECRSGTITISEINRLLHDNEWADPEDWDRDLANAELIVRAVNSHQALVDALRGLLADEYIQRRIKSVGLGIGTNTECGRVITDAMAALKLAEER